MKELLELRKRIKAKKPDFIRQDAWKKKKLGRKWRKPKGLHSKMRLKKRGYRQSVAMGWKSPAAVRGLDRSGLRPVLVYCLNDLEKLEKGEGMVIGKAVGKKKRIEMIKKAQEKGLGILNIKEPAKYLERIEKEMRERKSKKEGKTKKKEEKKVVKKKEEKKKEEKKTVEEKKEEEKKEREKVLIKRS